MSERDPLDERWFVADDQTWTELHDRLEQPTREKPRLAALLQEAWATETPQEDTMLQPEYDLEDYRAACLDASLGVGHIWYRVGCPAYRTYAPTDCTCGEVLSI